MGAGEITKICGHQSYGEILTLSKRAPNFGLTNTSKAALGQCLVGVLTPPVEGLQS